MGISGWVMALPSGTPIAGVEGCREEPRPLNHHRPIKARTSFAERPRRRGSANVPILDTRHTAVDWVLDLEGGCIADERPAVADSIGPQLPDGVQARDSD